MSEATYEEYLKAKKFARWKYKYGLFVLILCWISIVLLIIYVVIYSTELSTHPTAYMIDKLGITDCYCYGDAGDYYINNTTTMFLKDLKVSSLSTP